MRTTASTRRGRTSRALAVLGTAAVAVAVLPTAASAVTPTVTSLSEVPIAPHTLTAFPARDFVSVGGLDLSEKYVIEVRHSAARGGAVVSSQEMFPDDAGAIEINHPGGGCWVGTTPNIVADDVVRLIVVESPNAARVGAAEQTTVANVTAGRPINTAPGTVQLHGTAPGVPLAQLEARLVSTGAAFDLGNKRDVRAPGTRGAGIAFDAGSTTNWTATWTGLSDADVALALGSEAMGSWLGRDPAAAVEGTIYETGAGIANGPAAPCVAPAEKLPPLPGSETVKPSVPTGLTAVTSDFNTVTLNWTPSTDNVGVTNYGVYRNNTPIFTVQTPDGSAPAPTTFVDRNVAPGTYNYRVDAADAVDNRSAKSTVARATTVIRPAADVPVNDPPTHPFTFFPSRDMVDVEGLNPGQSANVEVIRNGKVISDSTGLIPDNGGLVEINHVGANCWNGVTPDVRTNDQVRATAFNADGTVAWIDQATIANVTAQRSVQTAPDTVQVHGNAATHDGKPLPVDQIEQRMVASSAKPFAINGRRTLRADASASLDGVLSYDPVDPVANPAGTKWTATYKGLSAPDVQLALAVESRIMWLGRNPVAGLELTIFENGLADPPGPATPECSAALEAIDTTPPGTPTVTATPSTATRSVAVTWTNATDNVYPYGYRVFRDGVQVAVTGRTPRSFTDTNVGPGTHTYAVEAFDSASPTGPGLTDAEKITAGLGQPYGNTGVRSPELSVTMPDVQAPSIPGNLTVTNPAGSNNARLVFDPSTDDSGAAPTYRVYRDGVLTTLTPALNPNGKVVATDTKRVPGTTYSYAVDAVDTAGNASVKSDPQSVTIGPDAEDPSAPAGLTATVPDIHGKDVVLSWPVATDNVGVTNYGIYRDNVRVGTTNGTTLTFRDVALPGGTYKYKVDAGDSAGNRSVKAPAAGVTAVIANDPPRAGHTVTAFPARDFIQGNGYVGEGPVTVEIIRNGVSVAKSLPITPDAAGLVEVNNAGPGCWNVNTPDVRAGDVVRITNAAGIADQTTAANVFAERPVQTAADTVVVHGTARDAAGKQLPLDQIEARLVGDADFRLNGTAVLRAPTDGTIAYDAAGSTNWTATFTGLVPADVNRALGADSVINWLGRAPLVNSEVTIFENGPGIGGGPAGTCTAPLEPTAPQVTLTPGARLAFADQGAVPASTSAAKVVTLANAGGSTMNLSKVYLGGANPSDFAFTPAALPATLAPGATVKVNVTFSPKVVGARSATLNFVDNAANTSFQTINLTGNGVDAAAPTTPGVPVVDPGAVNARITGDSQQVVVKWAASTGILTHYQLQASVANGVFADVATQPGLANSVTLTQPFGDNTRYQVRACNGTACTAWVAGTATNLVGMQEGNANVSFGGTWNTQAVAGAYGGSVRFNSLATDKAQLKTNGVGFQVVSTMGPDRGRADVWIDNVRAGTVDLYSATQQTGVVVFKSAVLANATHQVELRPLGQRNTASTSNRVDIDAFIVVR
jgi:hypothetical protein